jgi:alpha-glucosidase
MKKYFLIIFILSAFGRHIAAQTYIVRSPDKNLRFELSVKDSITYAVKYKNKELIWPSAIALVLDKTTLGSGAKVLSTKSITVNKLISPLYGKVSVLKDNYNELTITFANDYKLLLRAYNEGVAYRFVTNLKDSVKVMSELASFNLKGTPGATIAETDNYTAWELTYNQYRSITEVKEDKHAITPALYTYDNGVKLVIAEADLFDYPGMYVKKKDGTIMGEWAAFPATTKMGSWGDFVSVVTSRQNFIAKEPGKKEYPWRVIIATDDDKTLLTNQLIYKLSKPSVLDNTSWIKPGKAAWEWWHDAILPGAAIPSGMENRSTQLYNYYVDFAAKYKLEYLMIDAGWSDNYDIKKRREKTDIRAVIEHANEKHVGVFLWCVASSLLKDLDANLDYLKEIGAVGVKVDFFDRDDQQAIKWLQIIAEAAAKRHMMVDFHGCSKPTGLQRTYPNIINYEAVRGQECSKWDFTTNPIHHTTFPFIRMLGGPVDYTPGSMRNKSKDTFKPVAEGLPSTQGTRCHELAMFVVFDQPFGVLCDAPTEYDKYPDIMKYISAVPTVFDETKPLDAKVGEYIAIAKKKNNDWYVGVMTNWDARNIRVDFSFLPDKINYTADVYTDAVDSNKNAEKYEHKTITITRSTRLNLKLAEGGGAVVYLHGK